MSATREHAESEVIRFLAENLGGNTQIDPDMDLIDSRTITSMGFMNFVLLLEELTESPIAMEETSVEDFRTLRAITAKFLSGLPGENRYEDSRDKGDAHVQR